MERLNKKIADAGICSRRKADDLITAGKIIVNGVVVTTLGTLVSEKDEIVVDGTLIEKVDKKYLVMNKPRGVICSVSDELKRKTVIDLLPSEYKEYRLYPVGRLDYDTKGVLILTNDGPFMNMLVGPSSGLQKVYLARIDGIILKETITRIEQGILIEGKMSLPSLIDIVTIDRKNNSTLVQVTLTEGKYHQVKQMFELVGHKVKHLTRIRFGNITVDNVAEGTVRELTIHEVKTLRELSKQSKILKRVDMSKARRY